GRQHGKLAKERNLIVVGFVSSGDETEFPQLLDAQREAGARHVNVQLADHDTPHQKHCGLRTDCLKRPGVSVNWKYPSKSIATPARKPPKKHMPWQTLT